MKYILSILGGMALMYGLLTILSKKPKQTNEDGTTSETSGLVLKLAETEEVANLALTKEFKEVLKTQEFKNVFASLSTDYLTQLAKNLI
jgi:hypothetical protein